MTKRNGRSSTLSVKRESKTSYNGKLNEWGFAWSPSRNQQLNNEFLKRGGCASRAKREPDRASIKETARRVRAVRVKRAAWIYLAIAISGSAEENVERIAPATEAALA